MGYMTLGHLTLGMVAPLETIEAAEVAGFRSVSVRVAGRRKSDDFPRILGNMQALKEIRRRLDDTGIHLSSILPHHLHGEVTQEDVSQYAEAAMVLGADYILLNDFIPDDRILTMLDPLAAAVIGDGIDLGIEFTAYSQTTSLAHTLQRIAQFGQPNLKVVIDSLHLDRAGSTFAEIAGTPPELIAGVQICDARRYATKPTPEMLMSEARTARLELGDGDIDLYGFLDALPRDIEIEYEVPAAMMNGASPVERARRGYGNFTAFMNRYAASRGFAYQWD